MRGWDKEYGGLLYFVDCMGFPPEAYEHDMKLWWPHNEILIASSDDVPGQPGREVSGLVLQDRGLLQRPISADPEYGEWYGYLRRDGKPTEPAVQGLHLQRARSTCPAA